MTFASFTAGDDYRDAVDAAMRFADPASPASVLILRGVSGVGKSHLMQATATRCRENGLTVRHQPIAEFLTAYVASLDSEENKAAFRRRFAQTDALLLDNADELIGKSTTQEALHDMFVDAVADGTRVMLCVTGHFESFVFPQTLVTDTGGTLCDMPRPSAATRDAVLRRLCDARSLTLDPADATALIARFEDVPTLTGALNRLLLQQELGD